MRTYDDPVDVRGQDAPHQFLWRGRLYVVREVLSHWYERTAWWDGAAAQAVRGSADPVVSPPPTGAVDPAAASSGPDVEREVWRVEASAGRAAGCGVFDLVLSRPAGRPAQTGWRLVRVAD